MKVGISRNEMEALAKALAAAKNAGQASAAEIALLHAHFRAEDSHGTVWTVGLKRFVWHRIENRQWVPGAPPEMLLIDEKACARILALAGAGRVSARPTMACPRCAEALDAHAGFCTRCGTPRPAPSAEVPCPNRSCGRSVPLGQGFCTACGTPVKGVQIS